MCNQISNFSVQIEAERLRWSLVLSRWPEFLFDRWDCGLITDYRKPLDYCCHVLICMVKTIAPVCVLHWPVQKTGLSPSSWIFDFYVHVNVICFCRYLWSTPLVLPLVPVQSLQSSNSVNFFELTNCKITKHYHILVCNHVARRPWLTLH